MSAMKALALILLIGLGITGLVIAATTAALPTITLEKAVHFTAPTGEPVRLEPGTYEVEAVETGLRLTAKGVEPATPMVVQARTVPHGESLTVLQTRSEPGRGPDEHRVALLLPDGTSIEATGLYSAVRARGGSYNTQLGDGALNPSGTGSYNTAIGYLALRSNTQGHSNTALGSRALHANSIGNDNIALGRDALYGNTTGMLNVAIGNNALAKNTVGTHNTAIGVGALTSNLTGLYNTATGTFTLQKNTEGSRNTAIGYNSLGSNLTGSNNTAIGMATLPYNTTGGFNTATGYGALHANVSGVYNTAVGNAALEKNTTANNNVAVGGNSLQSNTIGSWNVAVGFGTVTSNTTGNSNTALGVAALGRNTTGNNNIALGYNAGFNQTTGSNNIYINNLGEALENGTARFGTQGSQTRVFVMGIAGVAVGGAPVVVTPQGQLGVQASSRRYKEAIQDMGEISRTLHQLRPVTFRYKQELAGNGQRQEYGLIAEEVAAVSPELVGRDADGQVVTVRYDQLVPMLLNELQKQQRQIEKQGQQIQALTSAIAELKEN